MRACLALILATLMLPVAQVAAQQAQLDRAVSGAVDLFEAAFPSLPAEAFGVDVAAYRDALSLHRFQSGHWGGAIALDLVNGDNLVCTRFAAYTRLPPEVGRVRLVLCPQFYSPGADDLRVLTILHEMVHVVAGPDECRAMAFAALVERQSLGRHTPVDAYWQANACDGSGFSLP